MATMNDRSPSFKCQKMIYMIISKAIKLGEDRLYRFETFSKNPQEGATPSPNRVKPGSHSSAIIGDCKTKNVIEFV